MNVLVPFRKCLLGLAGILLASVPAAAQEYFSYFQGKKIAYGIATDQVVVRLKADGDLQKLRSAAGALPAVRGIVEKQAMTNLAFVELRPGRTRDDVERVVADLRNRADVLYAAPMLTDQQGEALGAVQNEVVLRLKPTTTLAEVSALARRLGVSDIKPYKRDPRTFYLVAKDAQVDVLGLANRLFETGLFEFAEPNFLRLIHQDTNDEFYSYQWNLFNTGQYGGTLRADMSVERSWLAGGACRGGGVKVAIMDTGVQLNHPDLAANMEPGYDATGGGNGGASVSSEHGTNCAGIVAAVADNNIGVAGVAPNAHIVPIRVFTTNLNGVDILTSDSNVADAFDWAWQNNRADVISCSWGGGPLSSSIAAAISRAVNQGRNYSGTPLGCVVLFSSGNDNNNQVSFPALLADVVAVGASNMCDKRRKPFDCSNDGNWGSNYGSGLDVVAPGVKIATTTIGSGYNLDFGGTSAACPNAAGVVALILSTKPTLTQAQARAALESNTDKIGSPSAGGSGYQYSYGVSGQPNGSWNNEVGYGRVNAQKAVYSVSTYITNTLTVKDHYCDNNPETFSVVNLPAGTPVNWQSSNTNALVINPTTGIANMGQDVGYSTVTATYTSPTCGPVTLSQEVYVGELINEMYGLFSDASQFCTNGTIRYYMEWPNHAPKGVTYHWYITGQANMFGQGIVTYNDQVRGAYVDITPRIGSGNPRYCAYNITLVAAGSCESELSTSDYIDTYQMALDCQYGKTAYQYSAYPNPANSELLIEQVAATAAGAGTGSAGRSAQPVAASPAAPQSFTAQLYDKDGRLVREGKSSNGQVRLSVQDLPNGLYTLRSGSDKAMTSRRIQILH